MSAKLVERKNARPPVRKILPNEYIVPQDEETAEFLGRYRKKPLPPVDLPGTVTQPEPRSGTHPVSDDPPSSPFLSFDDLQELTNYEEFQKAVAMTDNAALLKLAWEHTQRMKEYVEDIIKRRLWGDDVPEGQLRFNVFEKRGLMYINAQIGSSTRSVPRDDIKALEVLLQPSSRPEGFAEREDSAVRSNRQR